MWCAAIKDENGQRKYLYSKERAVVSRRLTQAMNNLNMGLPATHKRLTVGAWLDYWLENIVRREREPTTYDAYEVSVRCHIKPVLGTKILRKLQVEDVERWLRELARLGRGVRTRQFALTRLRTALKLALRRGHVARNVAELTDMPASAQRKLAPPTTDELRRLLDVIRGDRLEALVILALATGLRRGELLGLRWEDVDLEQRRLRVHARARLACWSAREPRHKPVSDRWCFPTSPCAHCWPIGNVSSTAGYWRVLDGKVRRTSTANPLAPCSPPLSGPSWSPVMSTGISTTWQG
jgi:integrase